MKLGYYPVGEVGFGIVLEIILQDILEVILSWMSCGFFNLLKSILCRNQGRPLYYPPRAPNFIIPWVKLGYYPVGEVGFGIVLEVILQDISENILSWMSCVFA